MVLKSTVFTNTIAYLTVWYFGIFKGRGGILFSSESKICPHEISPIVEKSALFNVQKTLNIFIDYSFCNFLHRL